MPDICATSPKTRDVGAVRGMRGQRLHLLAGQYYFGQEPHNVHTLLGSCVAITLWNPRRRIGGMCHYLLPSRARRADDGRDARFGEEAVAMMVEAVLRHGARPAEFEAHLYGGADTLPDQVGVKFNVGERNIEQGWSLIDQHGFMLQGVDVGDHVPRTVELSLVDGRVNMRRGDPMKGSS